MSQCNFSRMTISMSFFKNLLISKATPLNEQTWSILTVAAPLVSRAMRLIDRGVVSRNFDARRMQAPATAYKKLFENIFYGF